MAEIGIVIPVYNGGRYLAETLESVLAQTFADWTLVIVDDGSTDESGVIADTFATRDSRICVLHIANAGIAAARNAGLQAHGTECAAAIFLDADDIWYPDSLQILHQALLDNPLAVGAHGTHCLINDVGHPLHPSPIEQLYFGPRRVLATWWPKRVPVERPTTFAVIALMNPIVSPGAALIRYGALIHAGEFDLAVSPLEDWDLWLRLTTHGYLAFVDRTVLAYRRHKDSASARLTIMATAHQALHHKHSSSAQLSPARRKLLADGSTWVVILLRWVWTREHWAARRYRQAVAEARRAGWVIARAYTRSIRRRVARSIETV